MICVNCSRLAINVEAQVFARPNDGKSFAFCLAIALFCFGQGMTGTAGNDVVSSCFWICLRENSCYIITTLKHAILLVNIRTG